MGNSCVQLFAMGRTLKMSMYAQGETGQVNKREIHYELSIRQTKIQSSGNPLNQKQSGDGKKSHHTHTQFF